jgi:hypothetical protein
VIWLAIEDMRGLTHLIECDTLARLDAIDLDADQASRRRCPQLTYIKDGRAAAP